MNIKIYDADFWTEWGQAQLVAICDRMGWTATTMADGGIEVYYPESDADLYDFIFGDI